MIMDRLTADQQKLVEDNIGLAKYIVNKYVRTISKDNNQLFDELIDSAYIALCIGATRYDETKGEVSTYLYKCVMRIIHRNVFYCWLRIGSPSWDMKDCKKILLFSEIGYSHESGHILDVYDRQFNEPSWDYPHLDVLDMLQKILSHRDCLIVRLRVFEDYTYDRIGLILDVSKERVRQLFERIRCKLKNNQEIIDVLEKYSRRIESDKITADRLAMLVA